MTLPEAATQIYLTVRSIPLAVTLWDQTHGKRDLGSLRREKGRCLRPPAGYVMMCGPCYSNERFDNLPARILWGSHTRQPLPQHEHLTQNCRVAL